ncbi:hypothetical protein ACFP4H_05125 [Pseudophaeobacter arcticus]|uniref:hypothetical protein n=1 Tax=Pseudophaeobacter arcticus TaxID=385492 RepID=UPI000488DC48|nr:hypothetical protein [Pseudophaeobacter arcticus]
MPRPPVGPGAQRSCGAPRAALWVAKEHESTEQVLAETEDLLTAAGMARYFPPDVPGPDLARRVPLLPRWD